MLAAGLVQGLSITVMGFGAQAGPGPLGKREGFGAGLANRGEGLGFMGRLGQTFLFFWGPQAWSKTLRNGPGMLLDRFSGQTVDSGPDSGHF